ncbi:MAG TPA: hypothetical protein VF654_00310 [Pyrinomonadaceae bacterium]|jgi:hypothetical protein
MPERKGVEKASAPRARGGGRKGARGAAGRARTADLTDEQTKWARLATTAAGAFTFWKDFFILRMGPSNNQNLSAAAVNNFMTIIRAVSWVESKHGTAGANFPARDPMQCGNPADVWWRQLIALDSPVPGRERFVTGPGGNNYWAEELPGAVAPLATFPTTRRSAPSGTSATATATRASTRVRASTGACPSSSRRSIRFRPARPISVMTPRARG